MTRVDLVTGTGPLAAPQEVAPTSGVAGAASLRPAAAPVAPAVPVEIGHVVGAAFERIRDLARANPEVEASTWVREAVASTLEAHLPSLGLSARDRLAGQIAQVLLDDPGTRQRLARLLGDPA
jgi:hypothetical protein